MTPGKKPLTHWRVDEGIERLALLNWSSAAHWFARQFNSSTEWFMASGILSPILWHLKSLPGLLTWQRLYCAKIWELFFSNKVTTSQNFDTSRKSVWLDLRPRVSLHKTRSQHFFVQPALSVVLKLRGVSILRPRSENENEVLLVVIWISFSRDFIVRMWSRKNVLVAWLLGGQ